MQQEARGTVEAPGLSGGTEDMLTYGNKYGDKYGNKYGDNVVYSLNISLADPSTSSSIPKGIPMTISSLASPPNTRLPEHPRLTFTLSCRYGWATLSTHRLCRAAKLAWTLPPSL